MSNPVASSSSASDLGLTTPKPNARSNPPQSKPASPVPSAPTNSAFTRFVILIKNRRTGNLHPVMSTNRGPGVIAAFETMEQAVSAQLSIPECAHNPFVIAQIDFED